MFDQQQALSRADLERIGREAGLDAGAVRRALDDGPHRPHIEADQRMARDLGASGTPTFFINGRRLAGAQPFGGVRRGRAARAHRGPRPRPPRRPSRSGVRQAHGACARDCPRACAGGASAAQPAAPEGPVRVPVDGAPQRGPDDALVTIVVFSDFQCPFCSRLLPTLSALRERYGNDLRVVWRNNPLPFHQDAMPAAEAAAEAFAQGGTPASGRCTTSSCRTSVR